MTIRTQRVAVCDLGTFSALILVAEGQQGSLAAITEKRHTIDLKYKPSSREIPPQAVNRAIRMVRQFNRLVDRHKCDDSTIVCTAAIRQSTNRRDVVARLRQATGHPVTVLSARQEGLLTARGAMIDARAVNRFTLIVDVGGGSTEITGPEICMSWSIPCGAAWLTDQWRRGCPRHPDLRIPYCRRAADEPVFNINIGRFPKVPRIIGVGGTITTLAAIKAGLGEFDLARVHGMVLTRGWITRMAAQFALMKQRELAALIPFDRARARILTAGTFLWSSVLNRLDATSVLVSVRGLRWGVADKLAGQRRHPDQAAACDAAETT